MNAIVLQTQDDCPPGLFGEWAARRGIELRIVRTGQDAYPDPRDGDFAVALGSSATATGDGPAWVSETIEWLRAADAAALPVLGICFGAQALAAALGGRVRRLPERERGWIAVTTADAERVPSGPWLAWHEDGFTLPPLAYELAGNAFGVQAFCHRGHLAVQFHPEATAPIAARSAAKDGIAFDVDPTNTRRAAAAAETLFDGFAARAGLVAVASRV